MSTRVIRDRENWLMPWRQFLSRRGFADDSPATQAVKASIDAALSFPPHDYLQALRQLDEADAMAETTGLAALNAEVSLARAELFTERGEFDEVWGQLRRMLALWDKIDDEAAPETDEAELPLTVRDRKDGPASDAAATADSKVATSELPLMGRAFTRLMLAELALARGAFTAAWTDISDALDVLQTLGDRPLVARVRLVAGRVHAGLGNLDEAVKENTTARDLFRELGDDTGAMMAELALAGAEISRSEPKQAAEWLAKAMAAAERVPFDQNAARVLATHARQMAVDGDSRGAMHAFKKLAERLHESAGHALRAHALVELAGLALVRETPAVAMEFALEALGAFHFLAHRTGQAAAELALGDALLALNVPALARARYEKALEWRERVDDHTGRIAALRALARLSHFSGRLHEAEGWLQEALEVAESSGADPARASLILDIGRIVRLQNRKSEARARFEEALAIRDRLDDDYGRIAVFLELATLAESEDADNEAEERLRAALRLLARQGDDRGRGEVLSRLGDLRDRRGDRNGAWQLYSEARDVFERVAHTAGVVRMLKRLGDLRQRFKRFVDARDHFAKALAILEAEETPDKAGIRSLVDHLGACALAESEDSPAPLPDARAHWQRCLELSRELGDDVFAAGTLVNLAIVARRMGEIAESRELISQALREARAHNAPAEAIKAHIALADVEEAEAQQIRADGGDPRGKMKAALEHVAHAYKLERTTPDHRGIAVYRKYQSLLFELSGEHKNHGDTGAVLKLLRQASDLARQQGDVRAAAAAASGAGRVLAATGDNEQAVPFFERARDLQDKVDDHIGASRSALELAAMLHRLEKLDAAWLHAGVADVLLAQMPALDDDENPLNREPSGSSQFSRQPELLRREIADFIEKLAANPIGDSIAVARAAANAFRDGDWQSTIDTATRTLELIGNFALPEDTTTRRAFTAFASRVRELLVAALVADARMKQTEGDSDGARARFESAEPHLELLPTDSQDHWRQAVATAQQS